MEEYVMNEYTVMSLGCFGISIALVVLAKVVLSHPAFTPQAEQALPKIHRFDCSSCGGTIFRIPVNARRGIPGDIFDGWYFEHACGSTQWVPVDSPRIAA